MRFSLSRSYTTSFPRSFWTCSCLKAMADICSTLIPCILEDMSSRTFTRFSPSIPTANRTSFSKPSFYCFFFSFCEEVCGGVLPASAAI